MTKTKVDQLQANVLAQLAALDVDQSGPLINALILCAISTVSEAETLKQPIVEQLRAVLSEKWILHADLTEVFGVLTALQNYDANIINGSHLATALQRLVSCELTTGGPYISGPHDFEPLANIFIAQFLVHHEVVLPNLQTYFDTLIKKQAYDSRLVSSYSLQCWLQTVCSPEARANLPPTTPSQLSLAELALFALTVHQVEPTTNLDEIWNTIETVLSQPDIWHNDAFIQNIDKSQIILSLAMAAGALQIAVSAARTSVEVKPRLYTLITQGVKEKIDALPQPLRRTGLEVWAQLCRADTNYEIALMPRFFTNSMLDERRLISDSAMCQLGVANFFCWMATIIYDDFIDEEGEPSLLPFANVAYRLSLVTYKRILQDTPLLGDYVEDLYTLVDQANAWEVANTRAVVADGTITLPVQLPKYGRRLVLAHRAFGHAIGPMLIVMQLPDIRRPQINAIFAATRHYLIARQLNDDLHDWRKDLQAGQLSSVVTDLLRAAGVRGGESYPLETLLPLLEDCFLQTGLQKACNQLLNHAYRSRQALSNSKLMNGSGEFLGLINNLEASTHEALQIQAKEQQFLNTYQAQLAH